jgi:predicted transcriptional regulator
MSRFFIEPITDSTGNKFWIMFEHGMFHSPTAVIDDFNMRGISRQVLGDSIGMNTVPGVRHKLRQIREGQGLTQADVSGLMGLSSTSAVSHYETGGRKIDLHTLKKWADVLGYYVEIGLLKK